MRGETVPVIFGFKLKHLREEKGYLLKEFAALAGLSPSYLNEIERGKKYPKADKIVQLADALGASYDDLVSLKLDPELDPLESVLDSPMIRELPLQLFGISGRDVFSLLTRAPHEAGALIRTLVEIARIYDMQVEHFFYAMLRSYQEAHNNYFEEIETAVHAFVQAHGWAEDVPVTLEQLAETLGREFKVEIDEESLWETPELRGFRSIWVEGEPHRLLLNPRLSEPQKVFQLAREIGYRRLGLKERGITSSRADVTSFEQVLNDFKASYFAGALMIHEGTLVEDLRVFFLREHWESAEILAMLRRYRVTPEMFLYRLTQLIPKYFGLKLLHFLRFSNVSGSNTFHLTKHFNMSGVHIPTGIALNEHYCRRWLSVEILRELGRDQKRGNVASPIIGAQVSNFIANDAQFFCISIARPLTLTPDTNTSVTIGFLLNDEFKNTVRFWNDATIPRQALNETCERCGLTEAECSDRAAPPVIHRQQDVLENRKAVLKRTLASLKARQKPA